MQPQVGDIVWFYPPGWSRPGYSDGPLAAIVTGVRPDHCLVSLMVFDTESWTTPSVLFVPDGDAVDLGNPYCTWRQKQ